MTAKIAAAPGMESPEEIWVVVGGTVEIGMIDPVSAAALRCLAGAIRLPEGRGKASGYGRLHIQENESRMRQIKGLGFATAAEFVAAIAANWTETVAANEANRLVLIWHYKGYALRLVVQTYKRGKLQCWSVVTAVPGRRAKPTEILFTRGKTDG